jgi:hypothetical protein
VSLTLSETSSIRAEDLSEWAPLAEDGGLAVAHAYLASVEADREVSPRYLVARDRDGCLAGVLPSYTWSGGGDNLQYYSPHSVLTPRPLQKHTDARDWLPIQLIGTRSAYWNEFLVHPSRRGDAGRREVITALLGEALRHGGRSPAARALMYLTPTAATRRCPSCRRTCRSCSPPPIPAWRSPGTTSTGYLAHLNATRRRSARLEMKRFAAAGFEVATCRLSDCWEQAGPLLGGLQRRHEVSMTDAQATDYLRAQLEALDDRSLVFLCSTRDEPRVQPLLPVGQPPVRPGGRFRLRGHGGHRGLLFNLAFYLPIRHAIEHDVGSIWW